MEKFLYTVPEIAEIFSLHPKTVQRFIREGKLKALNIDRVWKIHAADLKEYAHAELSDTGGRRRTNGYPDSADVPVEKRVSVSAVIELRNATEREVSRITNTLIAVLNSKELSWGETRCDDSYQAETGTARFILYGKPAFISGIMKLLEPLMDGRGELNV